MGDAQGLLTLVRKILGKHRFSTRELRLLNSQYKKKAWASMLPNRRDDIDRRVVIVIANFQWTVRRVHGNQGGQVVLHAQAHRLFRAVRGVLGEGIELAA